MLCSILVQVDNILDDPEPTRNLALKYLDYLYHETQTAEIKKWDLILHAMNILIALAPVIDGYLEQNLHCSLK